MCLILIASSFIFWKDTGVWWQNQMTNCIKTGNYRFILGLLPGSSWRSLAQNTPAIFALRSILPNQFFLSLQMCPIFSSVLLGSFYPSWSWSLQVCHSLSPFLLAPFYPSCTKPNLHRQRGGQHRGFWVYFNVSLSFAIFQWVPSILMSGVPQIGSNELSV